MRIKISADSTCDLSPELIETYNIGITPLYIEKGGQNCRDGIDITPQEIFDYVRSGKGVCRTAAAGFPDSGSVSSIGFCADPRASLRCVPGVSALLTESEGRNGAFSGIFVCLSGRILLPDVDLPCRRAGNGLFKLRFL